MALIGLGYLPSRDGNPVMMIMNQRRRAGCKMRARALCYVMLRDAGN